MLLLLLSAACLGCAQAAAASSETQILLNFKASITDGGGDLAQWSPADLSPCNWTGVRCSAGVVTEFSLQDMNVSGPVPIGLGMQLLFFLTMDYACSLAFFRSVTYSRSFAKFGLKFEVSSIRDTDLETLKKSYIMSFDNTCRVHLRYHFEELNHFFGAWWNTLATVACAAALPVVLHSLSFGTECGC